MTSRIGLSAIAVCALAACAVWFGSGQASADPPRAIPVAAHSVTPPRGFRKLAPGVETTVQPLVDPHDTVTNHNVVELLAPGVVTDLEWTPKYTSPTKTLRALATDRPFRSNTWYLQFTFKPLRLIEVDLPNDKGRLERKVVWYMVYRVKNIGGHLKPVGKEPEEGALPTAPEVQSVDTLTELNDPENPDKGEHNVSLHFFPKFTLEANIEGKTQVYLDKVIPLALDPIRRREDPNRKLLDSVEIGKEAIALSTATDDRSVWGVATWVGVDPRIDFFSIYVTGLTNAYRWTDPAGAFKAGDPPTTGRQFKYKTLQLNFWRPGDEFLLLEDEIHIGAPADKVLKPSDPDKPEAAADAETAPPGSRHWDKIIDYRWVFR